MQRERFGNCGEHNQALKFVTDKRLEPWAVREDENSEPGVVLPPAHQLAVLWSRPRRSFLTGKADALLGCDTLGHSWDWRQKPELLIPGLMSDLFSLITESSWRRGCDIQGRPQGLSLNTRENQILPPGSGAPSGVLEADEREHQK